jgi:hypothetical protein
LTRVRTLVLHLPDTHKDVAVLQYVLTHANPRTGCLDTVYRYSNQRSSGRVYAINSCQRLSRPVRRYCTANTYIHLNICTICPVMFLQHCANHSIATPELANYVTHTEMVTQGVLDEVNSNSTGTILSASQVKRAFLHALHCGSYTCSGTQGTTVSVLDRFSAEVLAATTTLYHMSEYVHVKKHVESQTHDSDDWLGNFVHLICEDMECTVIEAARIHLSSAGFTVRANLYDGLMVDNKDRHLCTAQFLQQLSSTVSLCVNVANVCFVENHIRMCTLQKVCNMRSTTHHDIQPTDRIVLFGLEGTLMLDGVVRHDARAVLKRLICTTTRDHRVSGSVEHSNHTVDIDGNVKIGLYTHNCVYSSRIQHVEQLLQVKFHVIVCEQHRCCCCSANHDTDVVVSYASTTQGVAVGGQKDCTSSRQPDRHESMHNNNSINKNKNDNNNNNNNNNNNHQRVATPTEEGQTREQGEEEEEEKKDSDPDSTRIPQSRVSGTVQSNHTMEWGLYRDGSCCMHGSYKSLSQHFPQNPNVVLIDAYPDRMPVQERRRVWTWDEEKTRGWTFRIPHHRDGLKLLSYAKVKRVVARTVHMLDDPNINPDTCPGKAALETWRRTAVLTGPQGAGKSFAALEIIRVSLQHNSCCVLLAPSRALAIQLARDLRVHLAAKDDKRQVLLYLEADARGTGSGGWDFLVVGPLSLKFHLPQLHGRNLGVVVIDELPELRQMLATFLEAGAQALEESRVGVAHLMDTAQKVMLISAQMQDNDIRWATDMMTTETRGRQDILIFDSDHVPRETVTWKVKDGAHLRSLVRGYIDQGKRVVCFAETVDMAEKLTEWFDRVYEGQIPLRRARSFTAKVGKILGQSTTTVSEYGKDCDFFVFTSALGLGLNLTPQFDVRFMIADAGFTSAKRLAQLAGRPRNCLQPDLFICIGQSRWRRTPGDNLEQMARNKVMAEYQESLIPTIVDGKLVRTLPDTPTTVARLQLARAAIEENDPSWKLDMFHYWSDSSYHKGNAPGYHLGHLNDEYWNKVNNTDKAGRLQYDRRAVFMTKDEARVVGFKALRRRDVTEDMAMVATNDLATDSIMPYMVRPESTSSNGCVLAKALLFMIYWKDGYRKLENYMEAVSFVRVDGVNYTTAPEIMFPSWGCGKISNLFGRTTKDVTAAILVACGSQLEVNLECKEWKKKRKQAQVATAAKLFALQTVTTEQQNKARTWIAMHWEDRILTGVGAASKRWGDTMPEFGTSDWWKFVGGYMRDTYGFGVEKSPNGRPGHRLVANGFWKAHGIDVVQVGISHRNRQYKQDWTKDPEDGAMNAITHNGRPYGTLPPKVCKCFKCPTGRPPTMCVRQNGSEWVCMHPDAADDVAATCHRDHYMAIDTDYLDVHVCADVQARKSMIIEEIADNNGNTDDGEQKNVMYIDNNSNNNNNNNNPKRHIDDDDDDHNDDDDDDDDDTNHDDDNNNGKHIPVRHVRRHKLQQRLRTTRAAIRKKLRQLSTTQRALLADLGYISGVYAVTTQTMQMSWMCATKDMYRGPPEFAQLAGRGECMKTVRKITQRLLIGSGLTLTVYRPQKVSTWTITIV